MGRPCLLAAAVARSVYRMDTIVACQQSVRLRYGLLERIFVRPPIAAMVDRFEKGRFSSFGPYSYMLG